MRWETIRGSAEQRDEEWFTGIEFRLEALTTDGRRVGFAYRLPEADLVAFPPSYGLTLDKMVAKIEAAATVR